jgi:S1-C subfamily serine protease
MTMGKFEKTLIGLALLIGIACVAAGSDLNAKLRSAAAPPQAISTVFVETTTGHGSGVHIGRGYILTAAHVVDAEPVVKVRDTLNHTVSGAVLWVNKAYDLALVLIDKPGMDATPLNCAVRPKVGDEISAIGNPLNLLFIHTWGRVAAPTQERMMWKAAFIADLTIAPGMSGGPIFDRAGNLIGLGVGVSSMGMTLFPISYIVPVSAVCRLMAKV